MAIDQHEIYTASLADLGIILLDSVDNATANGEYEDIEEAYKVIGQEVLRRIPESSDKHLSDKVRHLMDFHYKKWADLTEKGTDGRQEETELNNSYYEFRAMMTGFTEVHAEEDESFIDTAEYSQEAAAATLDQMES